MEIVKNIIIASEFDKPLVADVFFKNTEYSKPVILFCHGYKGFKDWGAWDLLANFFAKNDCCFIKFNFSHNGGTVKQPVDFPDLESFGNNTYSKELTDVNSMLDWIFDSDNPYAQHMDTSRIILVGHSRGGGIATLKAASDTRITKLVTWAGVSDFKSRFPQGEALKEWKETGVMYVDNARTLQKMPHFYSFYLDFVQNENQLTIEKAAKGITKPTLIIHGDADTSVLYDEALKLHSWIPRSELITINNATHVFGAKHPWEHDFLPEDLIKIGEETLKFVIL
ncbi:alpha/beta hydrolase family protein [Aquimarina sp. 2-A2]|uniref:alpha/beta hydrolase family protein n=1 Tax=Aquimarina sp. 2-A2 TaxID=3382644 RepID=UPI00387F1920